jgi:DNA-binding CsgD family transcriptional regulator
MSNREIASTLYMSVRSVEAHLTKAYRELGIRSRSQLAVALTAREPENGVVEHLSSPRSPKQS